MPNFRRFLSRRWLLAFVGVAALLFGVAMLHPYPRQSLFGPAIRGKPWCVWEDAVRRYVNQEEYDKTFWAKIMRWMGVESVLPEHLLFSESDMLPLWVFMAEDHDRNVRARCLKAITYYNDEFKDETVLPVLCRRLHDEDALCRVSAIDALWRFNRDKRAVFAVQRELDDHQSPARSKAADLLDRICNDEPEVFSKFASYAKDPDKDVRIAMVIAAVRSPDTKMELAVLIDGLNDPERDVRHVAAMTLALGNPGYEEAIPALRKRLHDEDHNVRRLAAEALVKIDRRRFPHLKKQPAE